MFSPMTTAGNKPIAFEFATATRIVFGAGKLREVGAIAKKAGNRALVVTGRSASAARRAEALLNILAANGLQAVSFPVEGEPTVDVVRSGTQYAREARCNLVIGFGGGSVIDAGKAIAALLTNDGDPLDYVEVIGKGKPITMPSAPFIAIPTTAGTGAEVTRNAVLGSHEHRVKVSMRSPFMLPRVAIVDPELTLDLPKEVTAFTVLDALTQLIEPFVSNKANPLTDAICREGMRLAARSLRRVYEQGDDLAARTDMATASLFGGLALANAGLGAVHGFAAPLGGMFPAPHGAVCAVLLPHVMEMNARAAGRTQANETLRRYEEVARILTGNAGATIQDGICWVSETCQALRIQLLRAYNVTEANFAALINKASVASSMKANPVTLTREELREILQRAL
jgi:alcohol dehydrogenase class IV